MSFSPIATRELRIAARRKSTFRIRAWTAILAILVSFFSLGFLWLTRGRGNLGNPLFVNLTGYAFGLCLLAGVFLTADCLSEEKREGTLGFLFLTDLQGFDVVAGKFMATFLNAFYGLLALLPIVALPILLGGVTFGEFYRTALALVNTLFISLSAGILVSAFSQQAQQAMGRALGLILLLAVVLPMVSGSLSLVSSLKPFTSLSWVSPFYPFSYAKDAMYMGRSVEFWRTLVASHILGWAFLALSSMALPNRWQERTVESGTKRWFDLLLQRTRGSSAKREILRRALLPVNPVLWLVASERGFGRMAWAIVIAWATVVVLVTIFVPRDLGTFALGWYGARPFGFLLKTLFVVQACRFFVEARRNGTLEMLLSTPLSNREIIHGQFMGLQRTFLWPVMAFVALLFVPVIVHGFSGLTTRDFSTIISGGVGFLVSAGAAVRTIADFLALFWFGLLLALTMKKPSNATGLTILAVLILPSVLCWLDIFADLFFILFGLTKLQPDLRWVLEHQLKRDQTHSFLVPPTAKVPPVIPA